jgi:glycosyltransferase involved in cell wall biosynthesis
MNVAFLNENALGHTSYLPRFAEALRARPELGVTPHVLDVLPLPPHLRRLGDTSIRGLRKVGLDFHATRWRVAISRHAREQLAELRKRIGVDAIVVNTQSVGLELGELPREIPTLVALDATFRQLAGSLWFAPNAPSRWLQSLTLRGLLRRERELFARTTGFLPWSELPAESLRRDYGVGDDRITILPPSFSAPPRRQNRPVNSRPQILFVGGHFARKGGPLLLDVFRRHFATRCELHLVTTTDVPAEPGVFVHRNVAAGSEEWLRRWRDADVFVFPSSLETFGIVLLEALAFEVPVIASKTGAAESILGNGAFGRLLTDLDPERLAQAIEEVLLQQDAARARAIAGRANFETHFTLEQNTERLARLLQQHVQKFATRK